MTREEIDDSKDFSELLEQYKKGRKTNFLLLIAVLILFIIKAILVLVIISLK